MKSKRHERIIDIINNDNIETQEELILRLKECGFEVTQATVSRDIRELKLIKTATGRGNYRYTVSPQKDLSMNMRFNSALADSIIKVEYSVNDVVIKTYPGLANAIATGIDELSIPELLGCVAGDDTIIIIMRDEASAQSISERIRDMIVSK